MGDSQADAQLNVYVRDYLQYVDLNKTVETLDSELKQLGRPVSAGGSSDSLKNEVRNKMAAALESGDHKKFFDLWNESIPTHIKQAEGHKIEFYINIYFAIFSIHPLIKPTAKPKPLSESMQIFQQFLATKGADLSKTSAFLAFYALPYVPDPSSHPSFQDLFTEEWLTELRSRVDKFLSASIKPSKPALYRAIEALNNSAKPRGRSDDDLRHIQSLEQANENFARQYERLQHEKSELLELSSELAQALEQTLGGQQLNEGYLQHLFAQVGKFFPQTQQTPRTASTRPNSEPRPLAALDYARIQKDLLSGNSDSLSRLLQALRWRLTRTEIGDARKRVFQTYVTHDLLGCQPNAQRNILGTLLGPTADSIVREYAGRLVNCMSCECAGRSYLLQNKQVISLLWDILVKEPYDTILRQQALGALQKLSLRRAAQTKMISMGLVDWILKVLSDGDSVSKYTLEYGSALLLNLSLRASGRLACEKSSTDVLKVLSDLLECDNFQVRFYTNGTLYSVLARKTLRERAHEMGMEDILKYMLGSADENYAQQIEHILKQLAREDDDDGSESDDEGEEEEEDDNDELVGDEEEAPEVLPESNPSGEALLCSLYLAKTADAQREDEEVRKSMSLPSPRGGLPNGSHAAQGRAAHAQRAQEPPAMMLAQQGVPQRPVTPGYNPPSRGPANIGGGGFSTMKPQEREKPKADKRPKTPGSLSNGEIEEMQTAFQTRAKMARTPQGPPSVPLEPLPTIKPRPKKKPT